MAKIYFIYLYLIKLSIFNGVGDLGLGDGGVGIGDWGLGPIPNPQSPIPNPHILIKKFLN